MFCHEKYFFPGHLAKRTIASNYKNEISVLYANDDNDFFINKTKSMQFVNNYLNSTGLIS